MWWQGRWLGSKSIFSCVLKYVKFCQKLSRKSSNIAFSCRNLIDFFILLTLDKRYWVLGRFLTFSTQKIALKWQARYQMITKQNNCVTKFLLYWPGWMLDCPSSLLGKNWEHWLAWTIEVILRWLKSDGDSRWDPIVFIDYVLRLSKKATLNDKPKIKVNFFWKQC